MNTDVAEQSGRHKAAAIYQRLFIVGLLWPLCKLLGSLALCTLLLFSKLEGGVWPKKISLRGCKLGTLYFMYYYCMLSILLGDMVGYQEECGFYRGPCIKEEEKFHILGLPLSLLYTMPSQQMYVGERVP